jgi:hypothetical protein
LATPLVSIPTSAPEVTPTVTPTQIADTIGTDTEESNPQYLPDNTINIIMLSDGLTNMSEFYQRVDEIKAFFFSIEPFKSRSYQFAFYTIENFDDLVCNRTYGVYSGCSENLVRRRVNREYSNYDVIDVAIWNSNNFNMAYPWSKMIFSKAGRQFGYQGPLLYGNTFVHEFGHAFADLKDEYIVKPGETGEITNKAVKNCYAGEPPAVEWAGLVAEGDYEKGCYYENWYRPSSFNIMENAENAWFDNVSIKIINDETNRTLTRKSSD